MENLSGRGHAGPHPFVRLRAAVDSPFRSCKVLQGVVGSEAVS